MYEYLYEAEMWDREIPRNSREYIAWVQRAMNQLINAGLMVDGMNGTRTRNAVRYFQRSVGLTADGVVGSRTEAAIIARGIPAPSSAPPGPTISRPGTTPAIRTLRANIVRIANQEWQRWNTGGTKIETDPRMRPILQDYWLTGVGIRVTDAQLASPKWQNDHPWSAAFISWVMYQAGADKIFKRSAKHAVYIAWAKQNRLSNSTNPFKAYRTSEVTIEPGDIVCRARAKSGATYDNITSGMKTHCDIVTEVQGSRIVTIGGNRGIPGSGDLGLTVGRSSQTIDSIRRWPYFAIIKLTP